MAHVMDALPRLKSIFRNDQGPLSAHARPFRFVDLSLKTLFIAFLTIDLGFILLNAAAIGAVHFHLIDAVPDSLKITHDWALPEEFNYFKWAVIVVSLLWLAVRDHWFAPACWAVIFMMILADDAFQFHEWFGDVMSRALPSSAYFSGADFGELLAFGAMGLAAVAVAVVLFLRSRAAGRALTLRYGLLILLLGGFGVGVDAVHQFISQFTLGMSVETLVSQIFGMIEEGGEMIVASFMVAMTLTSGHLRAGAVLDAPVKA